MNPERVDAAFAAIPRAPFLPAEQRPYAGEDRPLPIGFESTNSQPSTVRQMLLELEVQPGDRVLDVGAGSGWTTALLAWLVGPTGLVAGVELVPELVERARTALAPFGFGWASIEPAQTLGRPGLAPFQRILVSADAETVPEPLVEQLAEPGRMIVPAAGRMVVVDRRGGRVERRSFGAYRFVPLRWDRRG